MAVLVAATQEADVDRQRELARLMTEVAADHRQALGEADFHCPACADHLRRSAAILADLESAETALRVERRKVTALKKELEEKSGAHKYKDEAEEVFSFWREHVAPRAREFKGNRRKAVLARLEAGYTVKELKLACWGAKHFPFTSKDGTVYNDLELIARDATKVDLFMARGRQALKEGKGP